MFLYTHRKVYYIKIFKKLIYIYKYIYINNSRHLCFRCIELKFDQVNEFLWNLTKGKRGITTIWKDRMLHSYQRKFPKVANNEWLICILM